MVGLDGSPLAESILPLVGMLARALDARVTLLRVLSAAAGEDEALSADADTYLRRQQEILASSGVTVGCVLAVGEAADEITGFAERNGIDLIALASHGRSAVQRWLHGSVADRVLHATTTPLLVAHCNRGCEVRRVVVCLDGSRVAEGALPAATALASRLRVTLVRLQVVPAVRLGVLDDPENSLGRKLVDEEVNAAFRYLEALPDAERVPCETAVLTGRPAAEIDAYVEKHPGSLLVLTTHARGGLPRLLLGSVAQAVVPYAVPGIVLLRERGQTVGSMLRQ